MKNLDKEKAFKTFIMRLPLGVHTSGERLRTTLNIVRMLRKGGKSRKILRGFRVNIKRKLGSHARWWKEGQEALNPWAAILEGQLIAAPWEGNAERAS